MDFTIVKISLNIPVGIWFENFTRGYEIPKLLTYSHVLEINVLFSSYVHEYTYFDDIS